MSLDEELWTTDADRTSIRSSLSDPELAELDFEGQAEREATAPPETPAAPTEETVDPAEFTYEDEGIGSPQEMWQALQEADPAALDEQLANEGWTAEEAAEAHEMLEQLQDLADDDPVAAMSFLGQAYAASVQEQVAAEYAERLQPVFDRENQASAADTVGKLEAEFGHDVVAANAPRLAEIIGANQSHFLFGDNGALDDATRHDLVRQALMAAEYERQAAYARGDDVIAPMDELAVHRDAFGELPAAHAAPARTEHRQAPQAAPAPPAASPPDGGSRYPVWTEGGSTPPPSRGPAVHVDPVIAEMDEAGPVSSDMFGRVFR